METLNLQNPLFATYVIAATLMILKAVSMSWLTVIRMMRVKGGLRSPEDLRKTLFNPEPNPKQLEPNEYVERIRRIQLNDLESLPFFLVAVFLYVLTEPSLLLARLLLYGYVVSRLLHFAAYFTAQTHETRAMFWTVGSLIIIFMAGRTLVAALGCAYSCGFLNGKVPQRRSTKKSGAILMTSAQADRLSSTWPRWP
jgi:glutathione S-transferase